MWQVFKQFFLLGWTSFGGPAAHLGYFQQVFVQRLAWVDQRQYASMVALSQFLPGPGSSQVGFAIGYQRAGLVGGLAAFMGFTFPSFLIMASLASFSAAYIGHSWVDGIISGLKLLAVVIVADACQKMFQSFCRQTTTIIVAILSALVLIVVPSFWTQVWVLIVAAVGGAIFLGVNKNNEPVQGHISVSHRLSLVLFVVLFVCAFFFNNLNPILTLWNDFFVAGSLVFGGGHVVLPLLQTMAADSLSPDQFLTAYGAAQALPGPMFALASYLGALILPQQLVLGASVATLAIFTPGLLLMYALLPSWQNIANRPRWTGAIAGINASVVGILLAALYQPIFVSAVHGVSDLLWVLIGLLVLVRFKVPVWSLVIGFAVLGIVLSGF
ncbi:chromate efflux transporter [Alginatibacterium sediminis]|uniref:Chromate efflux transporter n=1 Tax=Alginatibacterium sediminis TaxID=2164068 RepID=A0A420E8B8_9ALTE|nr:chromate efflux transporter [Alginatibacterium sediminis]RKF15558.1 chromate efflux transporter [Alginatibacterium sediminis]